MYFIVSELAAVMGVNACVQGAHPVKEEDQARMYQLCQEYRSLPEDFKDAVSCELAQNHLPTIIRARVEFVFDSDGIQPWPVIAQAIHNSPAFARFVRVHPDAPAYYEWLVSSFERDLDGSGAYLWCTASRKLSKEDLEYHQTKYFALLGYTALALWWTLLASAANPSPNDFISPQSLKDHLESIARKLDSMTSGWRAAGKPQIDDTFPKFVWLADQAALVLRGEKSVREVVDSWDLDLGTQGVWYACHAEGETLGLTGHCPHPALKVCSRCKCVRYCSEEHQKVDWPTHCLQCFAAKW